MFIPLNLTSDHPEIGISVYKTINGYLVKPCSVINTLNGEFLPSYFMYNKDTSFVKIGILDNYGNDFTVESEDLEYCIEDVLYKLKCHFKIIE